MRARALLGIGRCARARARARAAKDKGGGGRRWAGGGQAANKGRAKGDRREELRTSGAKCWRSTPRTSPHLRSRRARASPLPQKRQVDGPAESGTAPKQTPDDLAALRPPPGLPFDASDDVPGVWRFCAECRSFRAGEHLQERAQALRSLTKKDAAGDKHARDRRPREGRRAAA